MTDTEHALAAIARAANDLVPELTERLGRHDLAEIEVSSGALRLRVSRTSARPGPAAAASGAGSSAAGSAAAVDATPVFVGVSSPAVGFFVYADGLGPGLSVEKGDALGHVEMLGVRHDVRAPRGGTVRNLVAESGEAVEYGQIVVELEPAEASR